MNALLCCVWALRFLWDFVVGGEQPKGEVCRDEGQRAVRSQLNTSCLSGNLIRSYRSVHAGKGPSHSSGWTLVPSSPVQSLGK